MKISKICKTCEFNFVVYAQERAFMDMVKKLQICRKNVTDGEYR